MQAKDVTKYSTYRVIHSGYDADLVSETPHSRIWITRMSRADGNKDKGPITVELLINGKWKTVKKYGSWKEWDDIQAKYRKQG